MNYDFSDEERARNAQTEAEAAALLPALEASGAARGPENKTAPSPNKAKVISERARKIRRVLQIAEKPPDDLHESLFDHARMLDVLFRQLMLDRADADTFDERFGLSLAMRAQQFYRTAVQT